MSDNKVVMISSTVLDLPEHREQVRQGCERVGFQPRIMKENLTALDANAVKTSLNMVEEADVYIGVLAYRYGHEPDGHDISITEMEYNHAVEMDKPRLIFLIHKNHEVTIDDVETGEGATKLAALKERIGENRVVAFFKSAEDLRGHVVEALSEFSKTTSVDEAVEDSKTAAAKFHRSTAIPAPPKPYVAHPYTLSQVRGLIGRQPELNLMTDWVANPTSKVYQSRLFCFVAIGGMGKSALTWQWFNQIAPQEMNPLAGRLWWSFYESDASFENFLIRALCYVSEQDEKAVRGLTRPEREEQLLAILNEQPFLLALDGLERILMAYHRMDASYLADDDYDKQAANYVVGATGLPDSAAKSFVGERKLRQTTDPRAGAFLKKLAQVNNSRILISSRLYPSELQIPTGHPYPGCVAHFLPGLSDDDALGLWRALGVSGSRAELVPIFRSVQGHPLLVQALASEVANNRDAPGDFNKWKTANPNFDPTTLSLKQSRTHILEFALAGLEKNVREVLSTLVGFRMPTSYETLDALLVGADKPCAETQGLDKALTELEDRGLIGWDREANRYDAHPIVRGVVWQQTSAKDKKNVYTALEAHFEPMEIPDYEHARSIEDLAPAIEHYHTLIGLGRFDDAFNLFMDRLQDTTFYRLSAHNERIEWLERLIPEGFEEGIVLSHETDQVLAMGVLAPSYAFSGQPGRAVHLFEYCVNTRNQYENKEYLNVTLANMSHPLRETGSLREAETVLRRALILALELGGKFDEGACLQELGRVLTTRGNRAQSIISIKRSQNLFRKGKYLQRLGLGSALLAERSLWLSEYKTAEKSASHAWELASHELVERDFIHAALRQGQATLGIGNLERADECLHRALTRARSVNLVEFELPANISIAELEILRINNADARDRLDEVWEAAERGPYTLAQADAFNALVDIELAEGNKDAAIEAATNAYKAAWCDGPPYAYHWGLEKAKEHLKSLGAPEPEMPAFDESKFEPLPEVEMNPKDEYWVDPDTLD